MKDQTSESRFLAKVQKTPSCWIWVGCLVRGGYGQFRNTGQRVYAHRWAYEHWVGTIPRGETIDHLCHNRACVQPSHLEPVPLRENILRGEGLAAQNARKVYCLRGHPLFGDNLYTYGESRKRRCRKCRHKRVA